MGLVISVCIFGFGVSVIFFVSRWQERRTRRMERNAPPEFRFPLPKFAGRILPSYKVKTGTFTVEVPFAEISSWGNEAIMTYSTYKPEFGRAVLELKAWRPDPETQGVFQLAVAEIALPKSWKSSGYEPYSAKVDSELEVVVTPGIADLLAGEIYIFLAVIVCLISGILALLFGIDKFFPFL